MGLKIKKVTTVEHRDEHGKCQGSTVTTEIQEVIESDVLDPRVSYCSCEENDTEPADSMSVMEILDKLIANKPVDRPSVQHTTPRTEVQRIVEMLQDQGFQLVTK